MTTGKVTACGSCGCSDLAPVLDLGSQPLPQARPGPDNGVRYPLALVRCPWCTLVQLDYIVPQEKLFPAGYPYATGNTRALREHFAAQARDAAALLPPYGLAVDIGGNDGTMLRALRREAPTARLVLVEPTDQARKCGGGIDARQEYFTADLALKIRREYGTAAVIVASNVFGHVQDPHDFLDGVTTLLDDCGTFIIDNQDWHNVVNGLQIDTIYHEHLRYYSPTSLSHLLAGHGLLVVSLNRIAMHGGAFRAVVRREIPDLRGRAARLARHLNLLLAGAVQAGPVYAVAAPTRATPLVNYADIARFITCACEVTGSEKIGAHIPGTKIPIVNEAALFADQPPHALLLAWDLADDLVPVLRRAGYKGKFIIPLPVPRVVE